ncbi:SPOR domain-containing protein [Roseiarcaceae bacterium H3SJ34-1]|uniref:SPOR domain-containing protein n=1 Tax=Terripilifer ovatus TaxID=3032367 RepID=UPI003AB97796|nr:SPOR domain-containing protein [Roseiarcaceae bacterium H3SJ34-1]
MSQAAAKPRDPIDLEEFERKLRGSAPDAKYSEDPLQELSRLIGAQPDPFDQLFAAGNQPAQQTQPHAQPHSELRPAPRQLSAAPPPPPYQAGATHGHRFDSPFNARQDAARLGAPVPPLASSSDANAFSELLSQFPDAPARFAAAHPADEAGQPPYGYDANEYAPSLHQDMDPGMRPSYDEQSYADPSERPPSRRPIYLMGAALIVLIAGIGAVLLNRAGNTSSGTPMIQASNAPVKVAPVAQAESQQALQQQQAVSVLDKSNTERLAASRVVNREEQPVDIQATARAARASEPGSSGSPLVAAPSGATANNGMFPEPRRVKTVSVRPDGSVITGEMAPSPSSAAPAAQRAPSMALTTPPAATPTPPSRPAASATTDRAAIDRLAASAAQTPTPKATARATAPVVANVERSPTETAAPAAARPKPADTTASTSGAFAAQLAAPTSEAEARSVMSMLAKRYGGELSGHKLSFRKATVGDKTVYRVRAAGLSQEVATGICTKLTAKGGNCFVARN